MRINKWIAFHSAHSRRAADALVVAGRVTINGQTAQLGSSVSEGDTVAIDGASIRPKKNLQTTTLILHKPVGYVCSRNGQGAPTVYSLVPQTYHALDIAGRLDKDSSGLVVLTDNGALLYSLTHPSQHKLKRYAVTLNKPLSEAHQKHITETGVKLEDGISKFTITTTNAERTRCDIQMYEGRNRQIRRTLEALHYNIVSLHRLSVADYTLGTLPTGKWKLR